MDQTNTDHDDKFSRPVSDTEFHTWLLKYTQQANLDEGYENRNTPDAVTQIRSHSPSQTGGCQRKQLYQKANAPRETPLPHGIFEFGNFFEDLFEQYLRDFVVTPSQFVRNPVEISFQIGQHTFQGSTDPVITDKQGTPILLTECKTTADISYVVDDGEPKKSHKIQAHIYAAGLQHRYGLDSIPPIYIIYADRSSLETVGFSVNWDASIWEEIKTWANETVTHLDASFETLAAHTDASPTLDASTRAWPEDSTGSTPSKQNMEQSVGHPNGLLGNPDILPPTLDITKLSEYTAAEITDSSVETPDVFECSYCEFYARCGGGKHGKENYDVKSKLNDNTTVAHQPPVGFLPLTEYPIDAAISHLIAHDDICLTPTLASQHPALIDNDTSPPQALYDRFGTVPQRPVYHWIDTTDTSDQYPFDSDNIRYHTASKDLPEHTKNNHPVRGPTPVEILHPDMTIATGH